jgi:hypothetical protein
VEIFNRDSSKEVFLSESKVPLNSIQNQDEYDIDLEMAEAASDNMWLIKARIVLIWSYFKLSQDNYNKAEKAYETAMNNLQKSNLVLQNLNGK